MENQLLKNVRQNRLNTLAEGFLGRIGCTYVLKDTPFIELPDAIKY